MKIALAHDSFTQLGGAERVIEALHEMYPDAPVFTLVLDHGLKDQYRAWDIRTSWLQVVYNFFPKLRYWLPLIPMVTYSLDFSGYDLVISSSSGWIKNIRVPENCIHIDYCHTPSRFLWVDSQYLDQELPRLLKPFKFVLVWLLRRMKRWDYKGAQRVTRFIANSKEVRDRIKKYYNRDSEVIYPFIDTDFWKPVLPESDVAQAPGLPNQDNQQAEGLRYKQGYFLIAGRLQAHKHYDFIVEIFNEIGLPLHVVGTGRQENYLKSIAKSNITFLGRVSDEQLREEYSGALAVICPQLEDLGLVPLEAAACGTPTLGLAAGGNLETIMPGTTGEMFENYDRKKIIDIILTWNQKKYNYDNLRQHAEKFSKSDFKRQISALINIQP